MKVVNKTYIYFDGLLNSLALQRVHDTFRFFHSFQILFEKKRNCCSPIHDEGMQRQSSEVQNTC